MLSSNLVAQWDHYDAVWEGKPGRMMVNMDFSEELGSKELTFLFELRQEVIGCDPQGFPFGQDLDRVESVASEIIASISGQTIVKDVGRLFYQCSVKDYFYLKDTFGIIHAMSKFQSASSEFRVISDPEQLVYNDFIYPDEFLIQTMSNGKIITVLKAEQYNLDLKSELRHFASFSSEEDRTKYRRFIQEQNFKVIELDQMEADPLLYKIVFTRVDGLQLEQLSNITLRLHQKAKFLKGSYDGWEIEVE